MLKILVTGFTPFGGEQVNPAWEAVKRLPDRIDVAEIIKVEVPTVFGKAFQVAERYIRAYQPDGVICVGQAGGRTGITPEKVAINYRNARIPDNEGNQPVDCPVYPDGPAAYISTLPVREMVQRLEEAEIPAGVSYSAGTFVCNDLMYSVLHLAATKFPSMRAGFIHVPYAEEQLGHLSAGTPGMPVAEMVHGLEICVRCLAEVRSSDITSC